MEKQQMLLPVHTCPISSDRHNPHVHWLLHLHADGVAMLASRHSKPKGPHCSPLPAIYKA